MNSKMRKYILTFGATAMTIAPLVTVVACGGKGVWRPATNPADPIELAINQQTYNPNVGINRGNGAQPLMLADYSTLTLEQKQAFGIENFELPDQINGEPIPANAKVYVNADGYSATDTATTVSFVIEVNGVKATETPVVFNVQLMDATKYAKQLAAEVDAEQTRVNALTFTAPEKNMAAITNKDFTSLTPDELASLGLEDFADAPEYDASKFTYLVSNDGITVDSSAPGVVSTGETVSIKVVSTNTDASLNVAQYVTAQPTPRPLTLTDVPSLDDLQLVVNSFTPGNGYIGNFAALNAVDFTSLTDEQKAAFGLKNFQVPTQPGGVVILVTADAITSSDIVGATKHVTLQVQGATTTATPDTITLVDPLQAAKDALSAEQARVNALSLSASEGVLAQVSATEYSQLSAAQKAALGLSDVSATGLNFNTNDYTYTISTNKAIDFVDGPTTMTDVEVTITVTAKQAGITTTTVADGIALTLTNVDSPIDILNAQQVTVNSFTPSSGEIGAFSAISGVDFTTLTDDQKAALGLKSFTVPTGAIVLVTAEEHLVTDGPGTHKQVTLQVQGATTTATPDTITLVDPLQAAKDALSAEQTRVNALSLSATEGVLAQVSATEYSQLSAAQKAALGLSDVSATGLNFNTNDYTYTISTNKAIDFVDGPTTMTDVEVTITVTAKQAGITTTTVADGIALTLTNAISPNDQAAINAANAEQTRVNGLTLTGVEGQIIISPATSPEALVDVDFTTLTASQKAILGLSDVSATGLDFDLTTYNYLISTNNPIDFVNGSGVPAGSEVTIKVVPKANGIATTTTPGGVALTQTNVDSPADLQAAAAAAQTALNAEQARVNGMHITINEATLSQLSNEDFATLSNAVKSAWGLTGAFEADGTTSFVFDTGTFSYSISSNKGIDFVLGTAVPTGLQLTISVLSKTHTTLTPNPAASAINVTVNNAASPDEASLAQEQTRVNTLLGTLAHPSVNPGTGIGATNGTVWQPVDADFLAAFGITNGAAGIDLTNTDYKYEYLTTGYDQTSTSTTVRIRVTRIVDQQDPSKNIESAFALCTETTITLVPTFKLISTQYWEGPDGWYSSQADAVAAWEGVVTLVPGASGVLVLPELVSGVTTADGHKVFEMQIHEGATPGTTFSVTGTGQISGGAPESLIASTWGQVAIGDEIRGFNNYYSPTDMVTTIVGAGNIVNGNNIVTALPVRTGQARNFGVQIFTRFAPARVEGIATGGIVEDDTTTQDNEHFQGTMSGPIPAFGIASQQEFSDAAQATAHQIIDSHKDEIHHTPATFYVPISTPDFGTKTTVDLHDDSIIYESLPIGQGDVNRAIGKITGTVTADDSDVQGLSGQTILTQELADKLGLEVTLDPQMVYNISNVVFTDGDSSAEYDRVSFEITTTYTDGSGTLTATDVFSDVELTSVGTD